MLKLNGYGGRNAKVNEKSQCFKGWETLVTYIDLCDRIQQTMDVKERTAKSYIKYMREKEIIIKDSSNQNYFIIGHII